MVGWKREGDHTEEGRILQVRIVISKFGEEKNERRPQLMIAGQKSLEIHHRTRFSVCEKLKVKCV
jgi:hypothetical protein